jgi:hypothetical protein
MADLGTAQTGQTARHAFDYAVVRVVPRVERDEFVNAGVIVHCPTLEFLGARIELDHGRLRALAPALEADHLEQIERYLRGIVEICDGVAAAGALGKLPISQRFHWLVAPRSHVVQTGPVHAGLCDDPRVELERLLERVVRVGSGGGG